MQGAEYCVEEDSYYLWREEEKLIHSHSIKEPGLQLKSFPVLILRESRFIVFIVANTCYANNLSIIIFAALVDTWSPHEHHPWKWYDENGDVQNLKEFLKKLAIVLLHLFISFGLEYFYRFLRDPDEQAKAMCDQHGI